MNKEKKERGPSIPHLTVTSSGCVMSFRAGVELEERMTCVPLCTSSRARGIIPNMMSAPALSVNNMAIL